MLTLCSQNFTESKLLHLSQIKTHIKLYAALSMGGECSVASRLCFQVGRATAVL